MQIVATVLAVLACVFIIAIGVRFLVTPGQATVGFGIPEGHARGLTAIKGVRDITSGVVLLVVLATAGTSVLGWALIAAALTPIGDAVSVLATGGPLSAALGIHGATAALIIAAGLVLALG